MPPAPCIVDGRAPASLLDTYHQERHPIGAAVLDWTRAQVALIRGDAKTALGDHAHDGRFVLLDRTDAQRFVALAATWAPHVAVVADEPDEGTGLHDVLIRPDGVVIC